MLAQQLVNGLMLGSVYALVGVGYTLIFGVLRMLNLAHAYIFMTAPFLCVVAMSTGMGSVPAMVLALLATAFIGLILYECAFRPVPQSNGLSGFVTSLSFGVVLQVAVVNKFGSLKVPFNTGMTLPDLHVGSVIVSGMQLLSFLTAIVFMACLLVVVNRTRIGRNLRALAQNGQAASLLGVAVKRHVRLVFMASSALAGLAGLMVSLRFESISAYMGDQYAIKALAVIVIGGLGDLRGAMIAGLLLGALEVLFQAYAPAGWSEAFVWLVLIAVFLFKPEGLFGAPLARREV